MTPLRVHALSDIGKEHHTNEDSWAVLPIGDAEVMLLVCDGMGGMGRGDEASSLAVDIIVDHVAHSDAEATARVSEAILRADAGIRAGLCDSGRGRPGCTAVSVYVRDNHAIVSWVGDSRAYVVRDGAVLARTSDHKLVEELVRSGDLTPEEAKQSSLSSVLTRALGGRKSGGKALEVSTLEAPVPLKAGDRILLCSDGLVDLVSDEEVVALVSGRSVDDATRDAVQMALDRGGHDNITVLVAEITDGELPLPPLARSPRNALDPEIERIALAAVKAMSHDGHTAPFAPERATGPLDTLPPTPAHATPAHDDRPVLVAAHAAAEPPSASLGWWVAPVVAVSGAFAWGLVQLAR